MEPVVSALPHFDSARYWEERYRTGRSSGAGSYGRLAQFKASFLNGFYAANAIASHIDFGAGDGNQLSLLRPPRYVGVDVSETVLERLRKRFAHVPHYSFHHVDQLEGVDRCDLSTSIDVIYHLIEDPIYEAYMRRLFLYARRFVVIYSSNVERRVGSAHVRHRCFTDFVAASLPEWRLVRHIPNAFPFDPADKSNTSFADFFVFAAAGETLTE